MTLGQLRTFLAVVRAGSVRAAAAALHVSEPSVSAAVGALERETGVALFEKDGRGIRLSAPGASFARYAAEALGLLAQGTEAAKAAARPGTGRLRLAAVTTAGEAIVPQLLQAFLARYPAIDAALEVGNRSLVVERLRAREADIGIGGRPDRGLEGMEFLANELVVVAAAAHPLAGRRRLDADDLAGVTWLLREPGSGTRATAEEYLAATGIEPVATLTMGSNGAVRQAAAIGLGVTLISAHAVEHDIAAGALTRLRAPGLPLRRAWFALFPDAERLPPPAGLFLQFLRSPGARRVLARSTKPPAGRS